MPEAAIVGQMSNAASKHATLWARKRSSRLRKAETKGLGVAATRFDSVSTRRISNLFDLHQALSGLAVMIPESFGKGFAGTELERAGQGSY